MSAIQGGQTHGGDGGSGEAYRGFCGALRGCNASALAWSHAATSAGTAALPSVQFRTAPGLQPVARAMPRSVISAASRTARKSAGVMSSDFSQRGRAAGFSHASKVDEAARVTVGAVNRACVGQHGAYRRAGFDHLNQQLAGRALCNATGADHAGGGGVDVGHLSVSGCLGRLIPSDECNMRVSIGVGKRKMRSCDHGIFQSGENRQTYEQGFNCSGFYARGPSTIWVAKSPARLCKSNRRAIPAGGHHGGV